MAEQLLRTWASGSQTESNHAAERGSQLSVAASLASHLNSREESDLRKEEHLPSKKFAFNQSQVISSTSKRL